MNGNQIEDTERAVAEAVAATLLAAWLLGCHRRTPCSQIEVKELAAKWTKGDGPVARTLQNPPFGRWMGPHLDHLLKATTQPPQF